MLGADVLIPGRTIMEKPAFLFDGALSAALTPDQYRQLFISAAEAVITPELSPEAIDRIRYTHLNLKRSERIFKTYTVPVELAEKLRSAATPQTWVVLTEPWCGDSAQNLPYLIRMAEINPAITFRIFLRDQHPEIMELYLTNGTRSIPILICFDSDGNEIFRWGPRPAEAHELVLKSKTDGVIKEKITEDLHLWYGRNKGESISRELLQRLSFPG